MSVRRVWILTMAATLCGLCASGARAERREFDVVVYGGTAAGVMAAVRAASAAVSVALLEPGRHIGGMVSGGLGKTDTGKVEVIGGMARRFFEEAGRHYGEKIAWTFEPHVAEDVFRAMLADAGVPVFFGQRVVAVQTRGGNILALRTAARDAFGAKVFVDSTYEGDLLARAGVSYVVGREGREVYGESLAGRHERSPKHQFSVEISPRDVDGELLPLVYRGDSGEPGAGDCKVQAYNFRLCLTQDKENQVPMPHPPDYAPARYALLARYLAARPELKFASICSIGRLPNGKTDINNNGPISTDFIGESWDYPEASYRERERIWQEHKHYIQGFFYFLAHDPAVPATLQAEAQSWGLAKDEFPDTDNWPHQMYVREARRMVGQYVMIQADLQTRRTKPDSIGMGSYNSDSHHVQRIPTPDGFVENEGDMQVGVRPYEIPYRALVPHATETTNLLVPACVSASHVAYSSMRMEPQYMIMGHAAGIAAARAARGCIPVGEIDVSALRETLRREGQVLSWEERLTQ